MLFNPLFTQGLLHAVKDLNIGICIRYRPDGFVFGLRLLAAKTKTLEKLKLEAQFVDDCALMADRDDHLQVIFDRFASVSSLFGLTVSLGKTETMFQAATNTVKPLPVITIEDVEFKCVETFKYLDSSISADGSLDREISPRIKKKPARLSADSEQRYKAIVLTLQLYGCETWKTCRRHVKQQEQFHMRSPRRIMGIRWQDKVMDKEVLDRAKMSSIEVILLKAQ